MDALLRGVAIFFEWLVLSAIIYCMLSGVRLMVADLGIAPKYMKGITMGLAAIGSVLAFFFIAHLIAFYPGK
ncbi:MAG: hypothetical protein JRI86_15465 [Deltaproteobacteria bacterium]|nr:hypothetical protein [Deltaproteobacteria bacterium]